MRNCRHSRAPLQRDLSIRFSSLYISIGRGFAQKAEHWVVEFICQLFLGKKIIGSIIVNVSCTLKFVCLFVCGVILTSGQLFRALSRLPQGYPFCISVTPLGHIRVLPYVDNVSQVHLVTLQFILTPGRPVMFGGSYFMQAATTTICKVVGITRYIA